MSGICGIVNFDGAPVDPELLQKMAEATAYRGPDGIHYYIKDNVGFAHLMLHTTPESLRERQPLVNARGDLVLTADARVDNRDELIPYLLTKGHLQEKEPTDAEVILAAYEYWGEEFPKYIYGEFAYAIWDIPQQKLCAARDQFGTRGFYYRQTPNGIQFATEVSQLLVDPHFPVAYNPIMIAQELTRMGWGDLHETYYTGIHKIGRAERLLARGADPVISTYWDFNPKNQIRYSSDEEYVEHFAALFRHAVRARLRTNNPVGVFMSGGLDSTSVVAIAADEIQQNPIGVTPELRLVHWTATDPDYEKFDERSRSRPVAERWNLWYREIDAQVFWPLYRYPDHFIHRDEPYESWFAPLCEAGFNEAQEGNPPRVWLNGIEGDHIIGGVTPFYYLDLVKRGKPIQALKEIQQHNLECCFSNQLLLDLLVFPITKEPLKARLMRVYRRLRPRMPAYIHPNLAQKANLAEWTLDRMNMSIVDIWRQSPTWEDPAQNVRYRQLRYFPHIERLAIFFERLAALRQAQITCPFDDVPLAEYVLAIPQEQIDQGLNRKLILRRATREVLPAITREWRGPRGGLPAFLTESLRFPPGQEAINNLLTNSQAAQAELVVLDQIRPLFEAYFARKQKMSNTMLLFLYLEIWLRAYFRS